MAIILAASVTYRGLCDPAVMNQSPASRSGPFWEIAGGRRPAPPAAATLGWQLSWVAPERGEIEVFFDARNDFADAMGSVQAGFLAAMLDATLGPALLATLPDGQFAPTP
jgi:acyl-coenzyme A thioesterase PaaI-like protein